MGYTDGERPRARGASALDARHLGGGRFARGGIAQRSLLRGDVHDGDGSRHRHAVAPAWGAGADLAVTAESIHGLERRSFMRVTCGTCGRSAVSDTLSATELCRLISWEYDGADAECVQCQWVRGEQPSFVERYGSGVKPEARSWVDRLADVGDWWRGGVGRDG